MDLSNTAEIAKIIEEVESERLRLKTWGETSLKGSSEQKMFSFRCRRLAKIRENLRSLAETYEQ